ncbi:MAG TPA: hypothetical protein VHL78_04845 [Actinomycetota bacterium]|nr:hypothetical protein [Actinomycetota bacterium]
MVYLKFVHILLMFAAVSIFVGGELYLMGVERARDVPAIRRANAVGKRLDPVGGGAFILGVGFGIITAVVGPFDLTQGWLILAYILAALILGIGLGYWTPRAKRIEQAAAASPHDAPSAELAALLGRPVDRVMVAVDLLLWAGIIFVMVVKPLS